jgi:hypothetical protein
MLEVSERLEHLQLAAVVARLEVSPVTLLDEYEVVVNRMRLHYLDWGNGGVIQYISYTSTGLMRLIGRSSVYVARASTAVSRATSAATALANRHRRRLQPPLTSGDIRSNVGPV